MGFNRSRSFKTVKYVLETVKSFIPSPAIEEPSLKPPFPALLRSNEPASDEEAKVVREFIATLDTLRATVASHQEASTLYAPPSHQEQRISSLISTHRGIISACRRIPDEIWQDIFIFAVEPTAVPATGLNRRKTPWRISCVCRRWNAIAISTPLLWTHIFVDASSVRGVDLVHRPSGYLSKSLERSKMAPLSVSIVNQNSHLVVQDDLLELLKHCNRWKHLRIKAPLDWIQLLRHRVKGSLSSLESLDFEPIRGHPFDPGQLIHLHCDLFEEAPKLREVRIDDRDRVMGRVQLPWSQLIQLRLTSCRTHPLQEIANTARRLSSLSLWEFGQLPVKPLPTIVDLDLADNECSISDGWNISQIFPSLQTLSIKGSDPPFMARIQPQLCQLTLLQCLTLKGLTHSLLPLPDIMTLRILRIDLPSKEELVRFIVREPAGSEGVFPSLEDLHIFMPSLLDSDAARRLRYIDQSDLYRILNLVVRTRCRRSPQSDLGLIGPSNTLFPLSAHPNTPTISRCTTATTLKSFRLEFWSYLTFSGPRGCTVHEQIESAWEREDSFYSSSSSARWEELATLEPWLEFLRIFILVESRGQSVLPLADALHWREKDRKFRQFEALEIVDLKSLYISGLHRVLRELLDFRFFYRQVEQRFNQYHFRERIRAILDKWAPRFQEDLPNRHWHLCHKQILAYVAEDDPIRKDPDALKIIYGPYNTDRNSESRELWNAEKPHLSYCRPLITNHWASDF